MLTNNAEGEVYAPVALWFEAIDLVLSRLQDAGCDFSRVKGLSGAGMQHGVVFWSHEAGKLLGSLKGDRTLLEQLDAGEVSALSHPDSPNWQDASTQRQCDAFDNYLGDAQKLADVTGSKAHHRFSGPQIMRFREKYPSHYAATSRVSLVSSFIPSVFLGKITNIDIGDVCGMNLYDIKKGEWDHSLVSLAAGGPSGAADLAKKLGPVEEDGGINLGNVSSYFIQRYGFTPSCSIFAATGDNPSTILSLPLRPNDAIVSLGTSSTFLMSTREYRPDPSYHFMNHPTTAGLYMFMLCYKNGGLAREEVRDRINEFDIQYHHLENPRNGIVKSNSAPKPSSWDAFNTTALSIPPLNAPKKQNPYRMGLYFPRHEIVPNISPGHWTFTYDPNSKTFVRFESDTDSNGHKFWNVPHDHSRSIVESQFLSMRLRAQNLVTPHKQEGTNKELPPQPRRIYLVGGGSVNPAIAQICGEVLGGAEGVYRLQLGSNACALGSAYKAVWAAERKVYGQGKDGELRGGRDTETFEEMIESRWNEDQFVTKIDDGYREGVFEKYGEALDGFEKMEKAVEMMVSGYHA